MCSNSCPTVEVGAAGQRLEEAFTGAEPSATSAAASSASAGGPAVGGSRRSPRRVPRGLNGRVRTEQNRA
eukprot:10674071-Lingulodinium_polyedra.AAC.1